MGQRKIGKTLAGCSADLDQQVVYILYQVTGPDSFQEVGALAKRATRAPPVPEAHGFHSKMSANETAIFIHVHVL